MLCVSCGTETEKVVDGLCYECYISRKRPIHIPQKLQLIVCKSCGKIKMGVRWIDPDDGSAILLKPLLDAIDIEKDIEITEMTYEIESMHEHDYFVEVFIRFVINNVFEGELKAPVVIQRTYETCTVCSRKAGNYYTAIVQVRGEGQLREKEIEEVMEVINPYLNGNNDFFITEIDDVKGGIDIKVSDFKGAKRIAKCIQERFGGSYGESFSLYGHKDGETLWRATIVVRIPKYRKGDILVHKNEVFVISGIKNDRVSLIAICDDYRQRREKTSFIGKCVGYHKCDVTYDAIVLSESDKEIMIMDPETYKTVELIKPRNMVSIKKDSIKIIKLNGEIYIYPEKLL